MTPAVPLKACWLNRTEMSCYFSHLSAVTGRGEFDESLIPGFPPLLPVGTVHICCEQPTRSAEMPKGCLFPDLIPNRDVSQRYLAQLTREGSYKIGGFHCPLPKDRFTWGNQYTVYTSKGVVTVISIFQSMRLIPYLVSPCTRTKKRSTTTTTNFIETPGT